MALCDQLEAAHTDCEVGRDKLTLSTMAKLNEPDPQTFADDARFALEHLETLTTRTDQIQPPRHTNSTLPVRGKLVARVARKSVVTGTSVSVREQYVGSRILK